MTDNKRKKITDNTIKENVVLGIGSTILTVVCIYAIASGLGKKVIKKTKKYIEDRKWHKAEQKPENYNVR